MHLPIIETGLHAKVYKMFDAEGEPSANGWLHISYDQSETESHCEVVVTGYHVDWNGFCELSEEEVDYQAKEMIRAHFSGNRVEFNF